MTAVVLALPAFHEVPEPLRDTDGSIAFQAAQELILDGAAQPSGYTEPILHRRRREFKAASTVG